MFESLIDGAFLLLRWDTFGFIALGLFLGMFVGALPGFTTLMAMAILLPLSLQAAGGLQGISDGAPGHLNWFNGPKGAPLWLTVYYVMLLLKYNANWAFVQRLYSVRDEKEAKKVAWLSAGLFLVAPVLFILPTVAARVVIPDLPDKEMAYVAMSARLLPAGMMGLMLAAMFSATISGAVCNGSDSTKTTPTGSDFLLRNASMESRVWLMVPNPARATSKGRPLMRERRSITVCFSVTGTSRPPAASTTSGEWVAPFS